MINIVGHRLLIKPYKQDDVDEILNAAKKSGFLDNFQIVNENKKREDASVDKGVVVQIGPMAWQNDQFGFKPWCKVGDEVVFAKFAGKIITDDETKEDFFVLNDEDIVAVTKEV